MGCINKGEREMPKYVKAAVAIMDEVKKAVIGKDDCVKKIMAAILAGGHILIEDIPGVGKTTLAVAFSRSMGLAQNRIQFTPDVLPADITGFSMYDKQKKEFYYQPGAVMCNMLLADEINRTSPKTQSALLEVMEEGTVTIDKVTRKVPEPFIVIATENPIGSSGTQMLPESQLDRFAICISIGYPSMEQEIEIVKGNQSGNLVDQIQSLIKAEELLVLQREVEEVYIHDAIYRYIGELVTQTRNHPMIEMGISPRGMIALAKMAKAISYLNGRGYCTPSDVKEIFACVSRHRIQLNSKARINHLKVTDIIEEIMKKVQEPSPKREPRAGQSKI